MTAQALHDRLQDSLEALARGVSLDRALARSRDLAAHLRPALEAAVLLREDESEGALTSSMVRSRARVLAALPSHHPTPFLPRTRIIPRFAGALAAGLIAVAAGLTGIAAASASALPDSPFYIFKLAGQELRLQLTLSSRARIVLQEEQAVSRAEDVRRFLLLGRMANLSFEGVVQAQDGTIWHVAWIPVDVPLDAYQTPGISRGMTVEVHGQTMTDGRFLAEAIHLVGFQFSAAVLSMSDVPGPWTIGEHTVQVTQDTVIDPGVRLGDAVTISVRTHDTDPLIGREILRLEGASSSESATPTEGVRPVQTQVPDGGEDADNGRGHGSGEVEETEEPDDGETSETIAATPEEDSLLEEEEGEKETHDQEKESHDIAPSPTP